MVARLASLEPIKVDAIERGLRRALDEQGLGEERASIVNDLVTVLEARERWSDAALVLQAEGQRTLDDGASLARAARNYLKARDDKAAEQTLLAAMLRTPEQGDLYRDLAVDVYAARGDFPMAEQVLEAGELNALDMLPVYDGVTKVLSQRELMRTGELVGPPTPVVMEDEEEEMP
jgi:hypothetical protein